jgi:PAS domain S-box-containing protein
MNVTLSIFVFVLTFIVLFGQNFWEKESAKLDYQLLNIAVEFRTKIQTSLEAGYDISDSDMAPQFNGNSFYSVAYYDHEHKQLLWYKGRTQPPVAKVLPVLDEKSTIQQLQVNSLSLISASVYRNGALKGYVWAYATSPEFTLNSFIKVSIFSILTLGFLAINIFLIRKYMKQIQAYLEVFSEAIVDPKRDLEWDAERLPELKPALETIRTYMETLNTVNQELQISEHKVTQIMEGISDGFFALDKDGRFLFLNEVAEKYFGYPQAELKGKRLLEAIPDFRESFSYQKMQEALHNSETAYWETDDHFHRGRSYSCHAYPFDEGLTVFCKDVTESKQQQAEFARLEKLNLIGQLAAGISHEIRNPLTTVRGFLQLRQAKAKADERDYYDLMISEIDRANSIITDFLSLAKSNLDHTKLQDINEIIHKIYPMLQADAYSNNKEILLDLKELPMLSLNENEIRQLLLNLVRNGMEVTPEYGYVSIKTYVEEDKIILAVCDQGSGIPEEVQAKIGTPFFTTKESGTGLGIAISIGIARRHNADLIFVTGSQGTTFKVIFTEVDLMQG